MNYGTCMNCKQQKTFFKRGVCGPCFRLHLDSIEDGDTTWHRLEKAGLALPAGAELLSEGVVICGTGAAKKS